MRSSGKYNNNIIIMVIQTMIIREKMAKATASCLRLKDLLVLNWSFTGSVPKKSLSTRSLVTAGKHCCCCSCDAEPLVLRLSQCLRLSRVHSVRRDICTKVPAFTAARAHTRRPTLMYAKTHMKDSIQGHFCRRGTGTVHWRTFAVPLIKW